MSSLQNRYLFADYCSSQLWALEPDTPQVYEFDTITTIPGSATLSNPITFGKDASGEIHIANQGGSIFQITDVTGQLPVSLQGFSVE